MSLEKIIERITQDSLAQANEIIGQAKQQATAIIAKARAAAASQAKNRLEQAQREADNLAQREKAIAQLELRKKMLAAKQELISATYNNIAEKITRLPDKEYIVFIKTQIMNAVETGKEQIIFSPEDAGRVGNKLIQEINQELKSKKQPGELTMGPQSKQLGRGFLLLQGPVVLNYSLDSILARLREETELKTAEILFKEQ
ncbi:MAG: V-type ATP synthase subunit E [bacterium]|nr:V-type ATP synthase subunit E [bacterium]MDD5756261.1 V-type ATP synthase subunit E [bacterium]